MDSVVQTLRTNIRNCERATKIAQGSLIERIFAVLTTEMVEVNLKKKTFRLLALISVIFALQGCATVQGIGEDIQSLGRAMKRAISG